MLNGMPPDERARTHTQTVSPLISKVREEAHTLIWGLLSDLLRPVLCILIVAQVISTLITLLLLEFGGKVLVCWRTRPADAKRGTVEPGMPAAAGQGSGQGGGRGADLFKDAICWNAGSLDELIVAQPATICLCPDARARMYGAEAAHPWRGRSSTPSRGLLLLPHIQFAMLRRPLQPVLSHRRHQRLRAWINAHQSGVKKACRLRPHRV